jgi:hypothetical protein
MCSILEAGEMYHAVDAGERGSSAAVAMRIKFLLGEDVAAGLEVGTVRDFA